MRFTDLVAVKGNTDTSLRAALDLYKGDLLAGWTDEWIERPRRGFHLRFLEAAKSLANSLLLKGAIKEALTVAHRAVQANPTDEEAAYTYIRAAAECREFASALSQYDILSRALQDDGSPPPSLHLQTLANELRARRISLLRDSTEPQRRRAAILATRGSLPLIERGKEHARLLHLLDLLDIGQSWAILLVGPAGIGKTRLVDAAVAEAQVLGIEIHRGACSDVPNPPLWQPVVEALREPLVAAIAGGQSPILGAVHDGSPIAGTSWGTAGANSLSPIQSSLVTEALLGLLSSRHGSPSLLVLENVQRADDATLIWLDTLLRRINELNVGVVLTVRTGEHGAANQRVDQLANSGCELIRLSPLTSSGVRRLVAAALEMADPPRTLCDAVWASIGGNPLRILRALAALQSQGVLKLGQSGWTVDSRVPDAIAALASSHITNMVQYQLRILADPARDILSTAAVMGGDVVAEHLQQLSGLHQSQFLAQLDALFYQGLLVSVEPGVLSFAHEEIRSAVLSELTPPRRHALHAQIAHLLSSLGNAARPEYLFWHFEAASDTNGACAAAIAAGDRCYAIGEHTTAITWYERALDTLSRGPQSSDVLRRLDVELKLEAALDHYGDRQHQLDLLDAIVKAASDTEHHHHLCEALVRKSLWLARMHRRADAVQAAERASMIARRWSDSQHHAQALRALGLAFDSSDDHASTRYLIRAIRLFKTLGAATDESATLSELATVYDRLGEQTKAMRSLNRAIALLVETDPTNALLKGRQGAFLLWQGRLSEAFAVLNAALRLSEQAGQRVWAARTLRVLGDAHSLGGRFREAISTAGRARRIATQAKDIRLIISALNSLLTVYARLGLVGRAEATFERIKRFAADDPESHYHALAESSLSEVYLESGRWHEARDWAERAIATASVGGQKGGYIVAGARHALGQALIELDSPSLAIEPLVNALPYHRAAGDLVREAHVNALLGVAAEKTGDHVGAAAYLHESVRLTYRVEKTYDLRHLLYLHGMLWERLGLPRKAARAYRCAYANLLQVAAGIAPKGRGGASPLRRHFLGLPINRRIIEATTPGARPTVEVASSIFAIKPADPIGPLSRLLRINTRREAILRALSVPDRRPTRRDLAAALGVTPRTITNDLAALRRTGHRIPMQI